MCAHCSHCVLLQDTTLYFLCQLNLKHDDLVVVLSAIKFVAQRTVFPKKIMLERERERERDMRHEPVIEAPVIEAFCQNHPHEQQQQQSWTSSPTFQSKRYLRRKSATKAALSEEERDVQIYRQRRDIIVY
jgi:hypothetical protein